MSLREPIAHGGEGVKFMYLKTWLAVTAILAFPGCLKAQESKPDQSYSARVGNKTVTSVTRDITTRDITGLSREELLKAAREAVPANLISANRAARGTRR
jgi:hypothetical protein